MRACFQRNISRDSELNCAMDNAVCTLDYRADRKIKLSHTLSYVRRERARGKRRDGGNTFLKKKRILRFFFTAPIFVSLTQPKIDSKLLERLVSSRREEFGARPTRDTLTRHLAETSNKLVSYVHDSTA